MITLVKGYKQGRAVMFYDIKDNETTKVECRVTKDVVVQLCESGKVANAKVQWWEGKAIVRVSDNIPLVKITDSGEEISIAKAVHNTTKVVENTVKVEVKTPAKRKKTSETDYKAYMLEAAQTQRELKSTIQMTGINTISDMFDMIANDFRLRNTDKYKQSFATKIDINKKLIGMSTEYKANLMDNIVVYLMNMANLEIRDVYIKYSNVA